MQDFTEQQPFIKLVDEMALKDSFLLPQQLCKHFCVERPQARAFHFRLIEYGCYGLNKLSSLIPITQNWLAKIMQVFFTQVSRHHRNPLLKLTYIAPESNHGFFQNGFCCEKPTQPCHLGTHVSHASGRGALVKKVKALEAFPVPDLRHSHLECFRASMG